MNNSYPSIFEVFILVNAAGTNSITEEASNVIQNKFNQFIFSISNKIVSLLLDLKTTNIITSFDIISILNENISSGDYYSEFYYQDNNELLEKNIDILSFNSNKFLTQQDRFNGSLRKNIDRSVKILCNEKDICPNYKITQNASSLIQRYIERKFIEYIKKLLKISENNIITYKLISSTKESIKFYEDRIGSRIKNFDFFEQICNFIDFNHKGKIINFETANEINTILSNSISAVSKVSKDLQNRYHIDKYLLFASINFVLFSSSSIKSSSSSHIITDKFINNMILEFDIDYGMNKNSILIMKCFLENIIEKIINNCFINDKIIEFDYYKIMIGESDLIEFLNRIDYYNFKGKIIKLEEVNDYNAEYLFKPLKNEILESDYTLEDFIVEDENDRNINLHFDFDLNKSIISKIINNDIYNPIIRYRNIAIVSDINKSLIENINLITLNKKTLFNTKNNVIEDKQEIQTFQLPPSNLFGNFSQIPKPKGLFGYIPSKKSNFYR